MSALFIILVSLTMTRFSEKMLISTRCIHGFMSNLIKTSLRTLIDISTQQNFFTYYWEIWPNFHFKARNLKSQSHWWFLFGKWKKPVRPYSIFTIPTKDTYQITSFWQTIINFGFWSVYIFATNQIPVRILYGLVII